MPLEPAGRPAGIRRRRAAARRVFLLLGLVSAIALAWTFLPLGAWAAAFRHWVEDSGPLAPIIFASAYMVATVLMVPGAPMTVTAGLAFGLWGIPLVAASATLGSALAFLIARHVARSYVERLIERRRHLRAVVRAVAARGGSVVLLLRLSPLIPFNVQNYLLGAAGVPFVRFIAATAIGTLPGTTLFVYIGAIGRPGGGRAILEWVLVLAGLSATAALAAIVARRMREELRRDGIEADL